LAHFLDCSVGAIAYRRKLGMPLHDTEAAEAWVAARPARKKWKRKSPELDGGQVNGEASGNGQGYARGAHAYLKNGQAPAAIAIDTAAVDVAGETLANTIPRLRRLERATAVALEQALKEGKAFEAASLRKQHLDALKGLYDAEAKLIKITQARSNLVDLDRLNAMIAGAIAGGLAVMRRLPELARDPEERKRFSEFAAGLIRECELALAAESSHGCSLRTPPPKARRDELEEVSPTNGGKPVLV
jgi:hypothetical protein